MEPIFIYALNCPVTGKTRYIGQTIDPDRRLEEHLAAKYVWHSARWIKSLRVKKMRPVMEILDVVPDTEADFWETEYIQSYLERGFDLTNILAGGGAYARGWKHTPEVLAKISASQRGNKKWLGKTHSLETREKMSAANRGRKFSPEHRAKLGAAKRGKTLSPEHRAKMSASHRGSKNGFFGKKHSPETREKISAARRARKLTTLSAHA